MIYGTQISNTDGASAYTATDTNPYANIASSDTITNVPTSPAAFRAIITPRRKWWQRHDMVLRATSPRLERITTKRRLLARHESYIHALRSGKANGRTPRPITLYRRLTF